MASSEYNQYSTVQDDSPSRKRKIEDVISDKEQADGEPQKKGNMGPVESTQAVNSSGVVGEEN